MERANNLPLIGAQRMGYETPPQGITLTGYINRRMHKTRLLSDIETLVETNPAGALGAFGFYAIAAATSWGPAMYQPTFDRPGSEVVEKDPETGAIITVRQLPRSPHYTFTYQVELPGGGSVTGREAITGTTVGFTGLGMPAPSLFNFYSANGIYEAEATGTINSELAPRIGRWQVRGYGELILEDNLGNQGVLSLKRNRQVRIQIEVPGQGPLLQMVEIR